MNRYDVRQQFIDGLDRYVSGIETDEGLARLAENVSADHDRMPYEACDLVCAIVWPRRRFTASYAGAFEIVLERLRTIGQESDKPAGKRHMR
jgi:hypothetical protein